MSWTTDAARGSEGSLVATVCSGTAGSLPAVVNCLLLAVTLILAAEVLDAAALGLCTTVRTLLNARGPALAALLLAITGSLNVLVFLILLLANGVPGILNVDALAGRVVEDASGVVLVLICQRLIVQGMAAGSVKG